MKYEVKATQTISKYFSIDAESESDAHEKAQAMAEEGEIPFDDEQYMHLDVQVEVLKYKP